MRSKPSGPGRLVLHLLLERPEQAQEPRDDAEDGEDKEQPRRRAQPAVKIVAEEEPDRDRRGQDERDRAQFGQTPEVGTARPFGHRDAFPRDAGPGSVASAGATQAPPSLIRA